MVKKLCIGLGVTATVLCCILAVCYFIFKGTEHTIYIEKEQIQEAINKKMPFEKKFLLVLTLTVKETTIQFQEGSDRMKVSTDIELTVKAGKNHKTYAGSVSASSAIHYETTHHRFYLQQPTVEYISIENVPDTYSKIVSSTAKELIQRYLTNVPVYTINDKNLKMQLAKAVLKDVQIVDGKMALTLGY